MTHLEFLQTSELIDLHAVQQFPDLLLLQIIAPEPALAIGVLHVYLHGSRVDVCPLPVIYIDGDYGIPGDIDPGYALL